MTSPIDFSKDYNYRVHVQDGELAKLGGADLSFGPGKGAQLVFKGLFKFAGIDKEKKYKRILVATEEGEEFTLFDCSVVGFSMSISYIICGNVVDVFDRISVRIFDLNEWFSPWRNIVDMLERRDNIGQLDVRVNTPNQDFSLSTEMNLKLSQNGEDHIVHEHVLFVFKSFEKPFSSNDIRKKCLELTTLLSILTAAPMYVASVIVSYGTGRPRYAFFSTFAKPKLEGRRKTWAEFFTRKPMLDPFWQAIFENYYRSEFREVSWVRLAGMRHYEGFWEFRTLGYVSLLDRYLTQRCKGMKRPKSEREARLDAEIPASLRKISPPLTDSQIEAVELLIQERFLSGKELHLREKLDHVMGEVDARIRSVINFSDLDFANIKKKVRDAVAHGDVPEIPGGDYGRLEVVIRKIELLLTYFAFRDLGLSPDLFLSCLSNPSPMRLGAAIDEVALNRIKDPTCVFKVSEAYFEELLKIKGVKVNSCFTRFSDGRIEYAGQHVKALSDWMNAGKAGMIPVEDLFGQRKDKIKCYATAYIESGSDRMEIFQAYFIEE